MVIKMGVEMKNINKMMMKKTINLIVQVYKKMIWITSTKNIYKQIKTCL